MILYRWKFNSPCRMRCNERRDRPKIEARRLVERRGLSITDLLTLSTFSGVWTIRGWPFDVFFITDPVVGNNSTHQSIVLWSGIAPSCATLNSRGKRRWTVTTESLFLKNCLTAVLNIPLLHGYWTDSVETILRRRGEVADLHSPDYYPFKKRAFFLRHPVYFFVLKIHQQGKKCLRVMWYLNVKTSYVYLCIGQVVQNVDFSQKCWWRYRSSGICYAVLLGK